MATARALLLVVCTACCVQALTRVYRVSEGSSPAHLGNIASTANLTSAVGCTQRSSLRYSLISQEDGYHTLFKVNETTGDFLTAVALDRENITACALLSDCPLRVSVAVQSIVGACFQKVSVLVILIDVNDNAPQFPQPVVHLELYENAPVGSEMSLPLAHDKDANTTYRIHGYSLRPSASPFSLVYTSLQDGSKRLVLRLSTMLDREMTSGYTFDVIAFDGGHPPQSGSVVVTVSVRDINDNVPHFTEDEYQVSIPENSKLGSTVFFLSATDLDFGENGAIKYDFADPKLESVTKHFLVDPKTGSITVQSSLENEGGNVFSFPVSVTDGGNPSLSSEARVVISVLDTGNNRPRIIIQLLFSEGGFATVSESAVVGRVVALVTARDSDPGANGKVRCSSEDVNFRLQRHASEYKVVVAVPLDRELIAVHHVIITCQDGGTPPLKSSKVLSVKILDSNDKSPQFERTQYVMTVDENDNDVPVFVGRVTANDNDAGQNAEVSYSLPNTFSDTFSIDEFLGEVYVKKVIDREQNSQYTIPVVASDHGSPPREGQALIMLKVQDQNDNRPVFSNVSYAFYVKENVPPYSSVGIVTASDDDEGVNGEVSYYMKTLSETETLPFHLLANGSLISAGMLDYEQKDTYSFKVFASDHGDPSLSASTSVTVFVLDENDHRPQITFPEPDNNSVSVSQSAGVGTQIAAVQAHDADSGVNGQLTYSLSAGNASDVFHVDADVGVITLKRAILTSQIRTHQVVITVSDRGSPALSAQAVLNVVVRLDEQLDGYVKIVVAIVCVTLLLVVGVTAVLCFLRYTDRQNVKHGEVTRNNFFSQFVNPLKTDRRPLHGVKQRPGIIVLGDSNRFSNKTVTFKTNSPRSEKKIEFVKCENCKYQVLKKTGGRVCSQCGTEDTISTQTGDCGVRQLDANSLRLTPAATTVTDAEDVDTSEILSHHHFLVRSLVQSNGSQGGSTDDWFTFRPENTPPGVSLQLDTGHNHRHNEINV